MHARRREPASKRRGSFRILAKLAAALICFAQLSSLGHYLLLDHAVCAEHGHWVHAGEHQHHAAHAVSESARDPGDHAAATASGAEEHEHCPALCERRERFALRSGSARAALAAQNAELTQYQRDDIARAPGVPLFVIAPKNSPPS